MSTRPYLGVNVNAASAEELRFRGLLEEGETLLALFDGVLLDQSRRRVGGIALSDFVALTDRRVITWARGLFNDTVDSFLWKDVDVVQAETWDPWHGRVQLAFRLPTIAPRKRRIAVNGTLEEPGSGERLVMNTLDYMPADDVPVFARMVEMVGDQIVNNVSAEDLVANFFGEFAPTERVTIQSLFAAPEAAAPTAALEPAQPSSPPKQERKRWWQIGRAGEEQVELTPPSNPANLVASYESQRPGVPAGSGELGLQPGLQPGLQAGGLGLPASIPEQPSMYEVSRTLRLFFEAPRRMARGIRRAGEAMGGANELVSGLQDPRVRRNAMRGLYQTAAQHEAEGGPLAPMGPVVRAAVRFAEPLESEQGQQQSRRTSIQVRSSVRGRRSTTPVETEIDEAVQDNGLMRPSVPLPDVPASPAPTRLDPVKRSISVRKVEPAASEAPAEPELPQEQPQRVAPVRRIAVGRGATPLGEPALNSGAKVVSENGNGVHRPEDDMA